MSSCAYVAPAVIAAKVVDAVPPVLSVNVADVKFAFVLSAVEYVCVYAARVATGDAPKNPIFCEDVVPIVIPDVWIWII